MVFTQTTAVSHRAGIQSSADSYKYTGFRDKKGWLDNRIRPHVQVSVCVRLWIWVCWWWWEGRSPTWKGTSNENWMQNRGQWRSVIRSLSNLQTNLLQMNWFSHLPSVGDLQQRVWPITVAWKLPEKVLMAHYLNRWPTVWRARLPAA